MNFQKHLEEAKLELQIAPLIDVVFLLLIYFIMTTELIKKEGDISFQLPAVNNPNNPNPIIPVEALIQISASGSVELDGISFSPNDTELAGLVQNIKGLKKLAEAQGSPFFVNILPNRETVHERVIDVMDACAEARVKSLSFSKAQ